MRGDAACAAKGITQVVFDRNGTVYRIKALNRVGVLADAAPRPA